MLQKAHLTALLPFIVAPFVVAPLVAAAEHRKFGSLCLGAWILGALGRGSPDSRALL